MMRNYVFTGSASAYIQSFPVSFGWLYQPALSFGHSGNWRGRSLHHRFGQCPFPDRTKPQGPQINRDQPPGQPPLRTVIWRSQRGNAGCIDSATGARSQFH